MCYQLDKNIFQTTLIVLSVAHITLATSQVHDTNMSKTILNLPKVMKAVGFYKYLPISDSQSLLDLEVSLPEILKSEVLVEVKAVSVNPIDTKIRAPKDTVETNPKILGFDGSGIIVSLGENVKRFKIGDEVFFAADLRLSGSNAQYMAVDEVLVGHKPKNFTFEQAAAMPVTSLTAYEAIYDRLLLSERDKGKTLLVLNSAGGMGSISTQLAKNLGLKVIGTASRPETEAFTRANGADIVLNHRQDLLTQLTAKGINTVDFMLVNYDPYPYWDFLMKAIKPQGRICLVVDSSGLVDIRPLKDKSVTLVSEKMSTRLKYNTEDKYRYKEMMDELSTMFENGTLKCTLTTIISPINAANLREAHRLIEEQHTIGKLVLSGF